MLTSSGNLTTKSNHPTKKKKNNFQSWDKKKMSDLFQDQKKAQQFILWLANPISISRLLSPSLISEFNFYAIEGKGFLQRYENLSDVSALFKEGCFPHSWSIHVLEWLIQHQHSILQFSENESS